MTQTLELLPCFRKRPPQWPVAWEGFPYLFLWFGLGFISYVFYGPLASLPFIAAAFYTAYFFRNPSRRATVGEGLIISPADGRVLDVTLCDESKYLKGQAKRISIFMSPMNCHINRAPVDGKVLQCFYKRGTFKAAFKPKSMEHNECHALLMEDARGNKWLVVQVAGFLARRIVSYVRGGEELGAGERFGLIQFGSRVDLYCPVDVDISVRPGDRVYAGKTILGRNL